MIILHYTYQYKAFKINCESQQKDIVLDDENRQSYIHSKMHDTQNLNILKSNTI